MGVPEFREDGWLPEGHYDATREEVIDRFGGSTGSQRDRVLCELLEWRDRLRAKGVSGYIVLDGSFVSSKESPGDFDVLIVMDERLRDSLENDIEAGLLIDYSWCKKAGFDMLPFFSDLINQNPDYLKVWDVDDRTGVRKGVLEVAL